MGTSTRARLYLCRRSTAFLLSPSRRVRLPKNSHICFDSLFRVSSHSRETLHTCQTPWSVFRNMSVTVWEPRTTHSGLRAQKPPPPGTRPAPLGVVPVPQGFWPGAPRQPGSGALSLSTPALADTTADGVDAGALAFLLRAVLEAQEEEARRVQLAQAKAERRKQRVRRQEMVDELAELLRASLPSQRTPSVERRISELRSSLEASSSSMPSMRRRKKEKEEEKATVEGVFKDVMVLWVLAVVLPCLPQYLLLSSCSSSPCPPCS